MSLVKELFQRQVIVDGVIVDCLVNPAAKDAEGSDGKDENGGNVEENSTEEA